MIIAVDIGGTKTLVALVNDAGQIANQLRFPTPQDYAEFINQLTTKISEVATEPPKLVSMAIPGVLDRQNGVVKRLGNLPWLDKPIIADVNKTLPDCKIIFENDANLAALSEANALENLNQRVLYITFSTGIGTGFVINGELSTDLLNSEGGHILFPCNGQIVEWEEIVSGRAIVNRFGKKASDLDDRDSWSTIAKDMAIGIVNNCAIYTPDTVVIGGGVGTHFHKYGEILQEEVNSITPDMVPVPKIIGARAAEEAVINGCIIYAKQYEQHFQSITHS